MPFICCVPGCSESSEKNLHSFPKNEEQCNKWINTTKTHFVSSDTAWKKFHKVCRSHFLKTDLRNGNLSKKGVVPSLKLPHSIVLEHDYCVNKSIIMSSMEATWLSSIRTAVDNIGESTHSIVMEHDYCINNSIIMSATEDTWISYNVTTGNAFGGDSTIEVEKVLPATESHYQQSNRIEVDGDPVEISITTNITQIEKGTGTIEFGIVSAKLVDQNIRENVNGGVPNEFPVAQESSKPKSSRRVYNPMVRKMRYLQERNKHLQKKLREAQSANLKSKKQSKIKMKIDRILTELSAELPVSQFNFIKLQLKNTGRAKQGNRFTFEEKTLALVIYKQSPKRYDDLRKISRLPTRHTLIIHSTAIRFKEGLNPNLMNFIRHVASQMTLLEKQCIIVWDEISLTSGLHFDHIRDYIDGFEDLVSKRTNHFATHALVFMVRGIQSAYKQPTSYYLTKNLNAAELTELIKLVISAVIDTGLKPIGSVCDAVYSNQAAVNRLIGPKHLRGNTLGSLLEYTINGAQITHIFDPPHLMKSFRNNLLVKNLNHRVSFNETKFKSNGLIVWNEKNKQKRTASWKDVSDYHYFNDNTRSRLFNLIPKITLEHINPIRRKMKVSLATQIFSATCGRNMDLKKKRKEFSNDCIGTAAVLLFFNDLFDSVNCGSVPIPGKLIGAVTQEFEHFGFWDYSIRMLDEMNFSANLKTGKPNQSNVFKHFISALKGSQRICERLFDMGLESVGLRRINQDGLENHFFKIRNNCGSNSRPNARDFRTAYTTAMISSQLSSHSLKANCEADVDRYILQDFQTLMVQGDGTYGRCDTVLCSESISKDVEHSPDTQSSNNSDAECTISKLDDPTDTNFVEEEALNCIAGRVCKQLLNKVKCNPCASTVISKSKGKRPEHDIMRKQSDEDVVLPTIDFINGIKLIVSEVTKKIPVLCAVRNISQQLVSGLSLENCDELIGCPAHREEFVNEMKKATVKLVIERYVVKVNRILSDKVSVATDNLQQTALEFHNKKKHIGKFVPPTIPKTD